MTIILQSAALAVVIFVGVTAVIQPLIDRFKVWLDV